MRRVNLVWQNKKTLIAVAVMLCLTALFVSSCASPIYDVAHEASDEYMPAMEEPMMDMAMDMDMDMEAAERGVVAEPSSINGNSTPVAGSLRHVIRSGSISLSVRDARASMEEVRKIVEDAGGLVTDSYVYEIREGQHAANLTLRVPQQRFDAILEQLENLGKTNNVETRLEDVTMHYVDLDSRLKNQEAQEKRLLEILDMAESVEDVLEVERELYRVRGEIESMSAQMTTLQDLISMSTIQVSLREEALPTETISPGAFENMGKRISEAFIGSVNFLLNSVSTLIIVISALVPALVLLALIIVPLVYLARRRRKKKQERQKQEEDTA